MNRKSITSFPKSLRWTVYIAPKQAQKWKVTDFLQNKINCGNFEMVRGTMSVSINVTNRKSHTDF